MHLIRQFVFHVTVEDLLWGIIPAAPPVGHTLTVTDVINKSYKLDAGVLEDNARYNRSLPDVRRTRKKVCCNERHHYCA